MHVSLVVNGINLTYKQVLTSLCIVGVKSLLAGQQQAAVTVAVEGLMDAKANADPDAFITFDPKVACLDHVLHKFDHAIATEHSYGDATATLY